MAEKKEDKIRNDVLKQIPGLIKKSSKKISDTLKNRELCEKLLTGLESKIKKIPVLGGELAYIPMCISLLRSYITKEYTDVPVKTMGLIVFGLMYFLSPMDIVPDALPGIGYLDDAAVIGFVLKSTREDLDKYDNWRKNQ